MLEKGVRVLLGSDNIEDICSPAGTPDLLDEVFVLCNAIRFYDINILSKVAAGLDLEDAERTEIHNHLEFNRHEIDLASKYSPPI